MILSAKTYTQAIVEKLPAKDVGPVNDLIEGISLFYYVSRQSRLFRFLASKSTPYPEKEKALDAALKYFRICKESKALLHLLIRNNQMSLLYKVISSLNDFRLKKFNIEEAEIISVIPLSDKEKEKAEKILEKASGHKILIREKVNPNIMGGVVLKYGDTIIDGSILKKIKTLRHLLTV